MENADRRVLEDIADLLLLRPQHRLGPLTFGQFQLQPPGLITQREVGAHPSLQLAYIKRFGDIIHAAGFKGSHLVQLAIQTADENDGDWPQQVACTRAGQKIREFAVQPHPLTIPRFRR